MKEAESSFFKYIENVGAAKERIKEILSTYDFKDLLSKHNPYWESENAIAADKLEDLRMKLTWFYLELSDVLDLMEED